MTSSKSARTAGLEDDLEQARRALQREGRRSPHGSDAYTLAAQTVQEIHHELHLSYADDRERL